MKYAVYATQERTSEFNTFDFISYGKKGSIRKRILFTPTEEKNIYNLAFGDLDKQGEIDDYANSGNGDRDKILATIADVVEKYFTRYPDRHIYFRGSTPGRMRLYRMAIGLHLEELSRKFVIYAVKDGNIVPFARNVDVEDFVIKKVQTR